MWWIIFATVAAGGLILIIINLIVDRSDNCYMYKISHYRPELFLVKNFKGCVAAVLNILRRQSHSYRVLGMDCEMTSTSVNGGHPVPATLQLATADGFSAIFQLKTIEKSPDGITVPFLTDRLKIAPYKMPSGDIIRQILADPNILKVGVAVMNDARYLEESYGLICKGCLDIRYMARLAGIEEKGLDFLAKKVLGKEKIGLNKKLKNPWESDDLTKHQIRYAEHDSRLGVEIFLKLNRQVIERSYSWSRRRFWDEKTYWKYSIRLWRHYVGVQYEFSPVSNFKYTESWVSYIPKSTIFSRACRYHPFIPESISNSEKLCFVCGIPDNGSLGVRFKAMVPVDYRVEFDFFVADDNLYYISLCGMCFEDSRKKVDYELRQKLTEECGAPYPDYEDHRLQKIKKLAAELLSSGPSDNEWRLILESKLQKFLPDLFQDNLQNETMEIILSMDCWPESDHGKFVHEYFCLYGGGLEELRWRWCERFWREMRPQYLPQRWENFYRQDPRWCWISS